jgi:hypothetical protein
VNEKSTIFWSAFSAYESCPQKFLWKYGWGDIDLGFGPGKGKPAPTKRSQHNSIMGDVIQYAIERMYNDELYREPKTLTDRLVALVDSEWVRRTAKGYVDLREARMSEEEMLEICREGVKGYIKTMKANRFLGEFARAEVELFGMVNKWTSLGGRADMIIRRADTGVTILDGKNSKHKLKYTDPDQVRWYALLFRLSFRQMPDRIGFVPYRFPWGHPLRKEDGTPVLGEGGEPQIEQGVEWVPFSEDDLRGLAHRASEARNGMRKKLFQAVPEPNKCRLCDWESVCPERQEQIQANSGKRGAGKKLDALVGADGFVDFS